MTDDRTLLMEIRSADEAERIVTGICVPYDEISFATPYPSGERVMRGAFDVSINERMAGKRPIHLYRNHDHSRSVGRAVGFQNSEAGLLGEFKIAKLPVGDEVLAEVREGALDALSVGFRPLRTRRAKDGVTEVVEGKLIEVSLLSMPAYEGAEVLAVRKAGADPAEVWAAWPQPPAIDLSPMRGR